jgi:ATP-binding cassette subfamily B protein
MIQALLFRGLFDLNRVLGLPEQRLGGMGLLLILLIAQLCLALAIASGLLRLGRHLEARLRLAFLQKIPRLNDRYFQSRLLGHGRAQSQCTGASPPPQSRRPAHAVDL